MGATRVKARAQTRLDTQLLAALPVVRGAALVVTLVVALVAAVAAEAIVVEAAVAATAVTVAVVWYRMKAVRLRLSTVRRSWTLCSSPSPHHVWRHNGSYRSTPTDTGEALERWRGDRDRRQRQTL